MYDLYFGPQSNRASWVFIGQITDYDDEPIDISGCSMVFTIRDSMGRHMEASTDNFKLTYIDVGTFRWYFSRLEMQQFCPGQCDTGLTLTNEDGTQTIQFVVGKISIVDGVVPT